MKKKDKTIKEMKTKLEVMQEKEMIQKNSEVTEIRNERSQVKYILKRVMKHLYLKYHCLRYTGTVLFINFFILLSDVPEIIK